MAVSPEARADDDPDESAELTPSPPPETETETNRHWQPHWARFDATGAVLIAVAEGAAFAVFLAEPVTVPLWLDRLPGDESIRGALLFQSPDAQDTAVIVSDISLYTLLVWPVLVDAILLAGVAHGDDDAALQMALIDAEVLAIAHMVTWLTSRLSGRARPGYEECAVAGTCADRGSGPVSSFAGGHTIMGYAAAGLVCVHHLENPWMTGSVGAAAAVCTAAVGVATATSFLRVNADRHWASDVWIGGLMGAAIGFGLPYVLAYGRARLPAELSRISLRPGTDGGPLGATIAGVF